MTTEERRTRGIDRIRVRRPVAVFSGSDGRVVHATTVDISPRGMAVELDDPMSVGDHLVFRLDVGPEFGPVIQGGAVAWTRPGASTTSAGVRFIDVPGRASTRTLDPVPPPPPETFRTGEELRIKVNGMAQALRAEAVEHDAAGTLRFRCPLAFLKVRSPVVAHRPSDGGPVFEGEIVSVSAATSEVDGITDLMVTACRPPAGEPCGDAAGPVEAAGLSVGRAWTDAPSGPAPTRVATGTEPDRDADPPCRDTVPDPLPPTIGPACAPAGEIPAGEDGRQKAEPRISAVVSRGRDAGSRALGRLRATARSAASASAPAVRKAACAAGAAVAHAWGAIASVVLGWVRSRRRGHLPRTLSDVRGRAQQQGTGTRTLVNRVAVVMAAAGLALGLWGLLGGRGASAQGPAPQPPDPAAAGPGQPAVPDAALPTIPSGWPQQPQLEPEPPAPLAIAAPPEPEVPEPAPAPAAEAPEPSGRRGPAGAEARGRRAAGAAAPPGSRSFTIPLDGPPTNVSTYGLREPPGIVIDVRGAGTADGAARIETGSPLVRLAKASRRQDGTRIIVYLRGSQDPRFHVTADGPALRIDLQ